MFKRIGQLMKFWNIIIFIILGVNVGIIFFKIIMNLVYMDMDMSRRMFELATYSGNFPTSAFYFQALLATTMTAANFIFCALSFVCFQVMRSKSKMQWVVLVFAILSAAFLTTTLVFGNLQPGEFTGFIVWPIAVIYHAACGLILFSFLFKSVEYTQYRIVKQIAKQKPDVWEKYLTLETQEQVEELIRQNS